MINKQYCWFVAMLCQGRVKTQYKASVLSPNIYMCIRVTNFCVLLNVFDRIRAEIRDTVGQQAQLVSNCKFVFRTIAEFAFRKKAELLREQLNQPRNIGSTDCFPIGRLFSNVAFFSLANHRPIETLLSPIST